MEELTIKEKLENLRVYMPDEDDHTYEFAKLLSKRVSHDVHPHGLGLAAQLELEDLSKGKIEGRLSEQPHFIYTFLESKVPEIAKAVGGEKYGEVVEKMYKEMKR